MERRCGFQSLFFLFFFITLTLSQGCSKDENKGAALLIGKNKISSAETEKRLNSFKNFNSGDEDPIDRLMAFEAVYQAAVHAKYDKKTEVENSIRSIIVNAFLKDRLDPLISKIKVRDEEIREHYEKNRPKYSTPPKVRAAIITIAAPKSLPENTILKFKEKAEKARAEALKFDESLASFGSVAVRYSDDQSSRYRGGDTGWTKLDSIWKRFESPVADYLRFAEKGSISPVISGEKGFYLVKLIKRKKSEVKPFNKVISKIRHEIITARTKQLKKEFYSSLIKDFKIRVNRDAIVSIESGDAFKNRPPGLPMGNKVNN